MGFEWDDEKDEANALKHGIRFVAATEVFDDPSCLIEESSKPEHGEVRMRAIGAVRNRLTTVIYTERPAGRRIISARRARDDERKRYDQGASAT